MSNLKKYLKVYKEDADKANAFKQYMQIVSENQDFFTTHEVNEFFTDMIKDGTLVYDEGKIIDFIKKKGLPILGGIAFSLASIIPSSSLSGKTLTIDKQIMDMFRNHEVIEASSNENITQLKTIKDERVKQYDNYKIDDKNLEGIETLLNDLIAIRVSIEINNNSTIKNLNNNSERLGFENTITGILNKKILVIDTALKILEKDKINIEKIKESNEEKQRIQARIDILEQNKPIYEKIKENINKTLNIEIKRPPTEQEKKLKEIEKQRLQ